VIGRWAAAAAASAAAAMESAAAAAAAARAPPPPLLASEKWRKRRSNAPDARQGPPSDPQRFTPYVSVGKQLEYTQYQSKKFYPVLIA